MSPLGAARETVLPEAPAGRRDLAGPGGHLRSGQMARKWTRNYP